MRKEEKENKKRAKVEKQLEELRRKGWLYIDGERDGKPVYKPTKLGLVMVQKKMKGMGITITNNEGVEEDGANGYPEVR